MPDNAFDPETGELLDPGAPPLRPFNQWLLEQRGGTLHGELTDELAKVVAACLETEKAGSLTVTIAIRPEEGGIVLVSDEIKAKVPENRGAALYYANERGSLSRENPRQPQLPLREVPGAGTTAPGGQSK